MPTETTTKLSAELVESTFLDCLFKEGEDTANHVVVNGITLDVGFHPGRLEENKEKIIALLAELPDPFHEKSGGGWSFLNACNDKHNNQWGEHRHMELLFLLGMAIGKVSCLVPRESWAILPGGMPYYMIKAD